MSQSAKEASEYGRDDCAFAYRATKEKACWGELVINDEWVI